MRHRFALILAIAALPVIASAGRVRRWRGPRSPYAWTAALGDSITSGQAGITPWPSTLAAAVGGNYRITNFGVSGYTVANMQTKWANEVRGKGYRVLAIMCCVNDIRNGASAASVEPTYQAIIDQARSDGMTVMLLAATPWKGDGSWSAGKQTEHLALKAWEVAYCVSNPIGCKAIDTYTPLNDGANDGGMLAGDDSGDHLHPNTAGENLIASTIQANL